MRWLLGAVVFLLYGVTSIAQTSEFLPEINLYVGLARTSRLAFQVKETRENGIPAQAEIGPSIDFHLRPMKNLIPNNVDESKTRFILVSFGYRYLPSADGPEIHRALAVATPRYPLASKLVVSDRNRAELNFSQGVTTWRYRNLLQIERETSIFGYNPTPYTNVEFYYDSRFSKWSSTAIEAGCQLPIGKHTEIDIYYEHQNNTGEPPNQQVNAVGIMLNLHIKKDY